MARWNCTMGKYQPGRGTWPTPQNRKWTNLKFRLGTYILPPTPNTCPTLWQTNAWLCLISYCIFCSLFLYFCTEFSWQYNAMHKFFRALDNPPPIQEQTSQVARFWGQSHSLRHKNLTSQWNTLFEYFHFCLVKSIFRHQFCRKVLRHIHFYLSYLIILLTR